jgi:hypothetical protein
MSVEDRMRDLEEEMEERYGRKLEIKTIREWLKDFGYTPPENPTDLRAELSTFVDRLADLGIIVVESDGVADRKVYRWLMKQLNGHMRLPRNEEELLYLPYYRDDS